jgi:hypothetical protein
MLAEARTRWNQYHDGQAHSEAQQLIAMVQQVLRPAKPGQAYIDTAHGPALVLLMQGVTAQLIATHAARLQHLIDTSYQAERRARAGHQRARAAARRANGLQPIDLPLPQEQPTALGRAQSAAAINGYIRAQRQQHQVVPPTPPRRRPGGFAA